MTAADCNQPPIRPGSGQPENGQAPPAAKAVPGADRGDEFIIFGSPRIEEPEIQEVVETLRSGWLGTGPRVKKFEEMFARYTGAAHACAVSSCTAALHLALIVAGVGPGDEVITTPITFAATANAIVHAGATPVFADVEPATMNISPEAVEAAITERTRAVIPVHLAGRPCRMDAIREIAGKHGLAVVEDAAHAVEAWYHGRKVGAGDNLACFSFYVTKNLCTGEGGMLTTARADWAEKARILSLHGLSKDAWTRYSTAPCRHYQVLYPGYKYNMTDVQAALGIHQLGRVEQYLIRRNEIWAQYDGAFGGLPIEIPPPPEPWTVHARHLYTILVERQRCGFSRDEMREELHRRGIGTGVHFTSLAEHPFYRERFPARQPLPNAERISARTLSLPLSAKLTDPQVGRIIEAVSALCGGGPK
jgi:dTDP-4-amino-4,6-dideoxygalactose transaminase